MASDTVRLSSGREFYANHSILGLSLDREDAFFGEVHHGYDGTVFAEDFTPDEKRELALVMIRRWQEWAGIVP